MLSTPRQRLEGWIDVIFPAVSSLPFATSPSEVFTTITESAIKSHVALIQDLSLPKSLTTKKFLDMLRKDDGAAFEGLPLDLTKKVEVAWEIESRSSTLPMQFWIEGVDRWLDALDKQTLRSVLKQCGIVEDADLDVAVGPGSAHGINFLLHLVFPVKGAVDLLPILHASAVITKTSSTSTSKTPNAKKRAKEDDAVSEGEDAAQVHKDDEGEGEGDKSHQSPTPSAKSVKTSAQHKSPSTQSSSAAKGSGKKKTATTPTQKEASQQEQASETHSTPPTTTKRSRSNTATSPQTSSLSPGAIALPNNQNPPLRFRIDAAKAKILKEAPMTLPREEVALFRNPIRKGITEFELMNHYWIEDLKTYIDEEGVKIPKTKKSVIIKGILKHVNGE
eukprot:PhF_6_TR10984/c1_g1_i1/m.17762